MELNKELMDRYNKLGLDMMYLGVPLRNISNALLIELIELYQTQIILPSTTTKEIIKYNTLIYIYSDVQCKKREERLLYLKSKINDTIRKL